MALRVLLIGSDREIVHMTGKILRRNGYDVQTAVGPQEALALLRSQPFDLVVLDRDMRQSDCVKLIQRVKEQPVPSPLLVISGEREDEILFLNTGADDWIQKPYQMNVLLRRNQPREV